MTDAFVPTVKLISEEEASDEVRQIYNEIKEFYNLDFVPQQYRALAHNVDHLREDWQIERAWYEGELGMDAKTADIIGLTVAATRACPYCINWHTTTLKAAGMSDADIENLINVVSLANSGVTFVTGTQLTPDITPGLAERMAQSPAMQSERKRMTRAA